LHFIRQGLPAAKAGAQGGADVFHRNALRADGDLLGGEELALQACFPHRVTYRVQIDLCTILQLNPDLEIDLPALMHRRRL